MPTHAQLAAKLLRDAAAFFKDLAQQNPEISDQMSDNAQIYEQIAGLVEEKPNEELETQEQGEQEA
jgi:hypothetical protein